MSGFYFSFTFKSSKNITYFLPVNLFNDNKVINELYFKVMKKNIAQRYELKSYEEPRFIESDILPELSTKTTVDFMMTEWEFLNTKPDYGLSFDENVDKIGRLEFQEYGYNLSEVDPYSSKSLMRIVDKYILSAQVISNPDNNEIDSLQLDIFVV